MSSYKWCDRCSSRLIGKYYTLKKPNGGTIELCTICLPLVQFRLRMLSAKPDNKVKKLIESGWKDFKKATRHDPGNDQIKTNMKGTKPLLKIRRGSWFRYAFMCFRYVFIWLPLWSLTKVFRFRAFKLLIGELLKERSITISSTDTERNFIHSTLLMLILLCSICIRYANHVVVTGHIAIIRKIGTDLKGIIIGVILVVIILMFLRYFWIGICQKRWRYKKTFARFFEISVYLYFLYLCFVRTKYLMS